MSNHIRNTERANINIYVPSLFIIVMVVSLILDSFFPSSMYSAAWAEKAGLILIALGSILLYTAHRSAKTIRKDIRASDDNIVDFFIGPYRYMRHPGYTGMVLIGVGLSLVINSAIILVSSIVFYLIARTVVVTEEEHILHEDSQMKHHYRAYTKKVKRFF